MCHSDGLAERYFYGSFTGSEELLVACYHDVTGRLLKDVLQLTNNADMVLGQGGHAMLDAYFTTLRREPKAARVFLIEMRAVSPAGLAVFRAAIRRIARRTMHIFGVTDSGANELLTVGIIGGINEIALHWAAHDYTLSIEEVIDVALQLCRSFIRLSRS
jgi:hypothetical protein